jgi:uncharacterized protein YndB with AHSA1/START domain
MTDPIVHRPNPKFDLVLERVVDVPPSLVWTCWTVPEHIKKWFTPAPWKTVDAEVDLRPGGTFRFVMQSPEGQNTPYVCCFLEIVEKKKLVWTRALAPGYRPVLEQPEVPLFTAVITMEPEGKGTRYRALVIHGDEAGRDKHAEMGFEEGWGTCLDQLVAVAKKM